MFHLNASCSLNRRYHPGEREFHLRGRRWQEHAPDPQGRLPAPHEAGPRSGENREIFGVGRDGHEGPRRRDGALQDHRNRHLRRECCCRCCCVAAVVVSFSVAVSGFAVAKRGPAGDEHVPRAEACLANARINCNAVVLVVVADVLDGAVTADVFYAATLSPSQFPRR